MGSSNSASPKSVRFSEVIEEVIEIPARGDEMIHVHEEEVEKEKSTLEKEAFMSFRSCPCLGPSRCDGTLERQSLPGMHQRRHVVVEAGCLRCYQEGEMELFVSFVKEPCIVEEDEDNILGFSIRPQTGRWLTGDYGSAGGACILKFGTCGSEHEKDTWVASVEAHISFAQNLSCSARIPLTEKKFADVTGQALARPAKALSFSQDLPKSGYGFAGKTQKGWGPEWWGITLRQLEDMRNLQGYWIGMNARDFVKEVIKPQTLGKGMGYSLMINEEKPLRITNFVSHCWDESFDHFIDALTKAPNSDDGIFWICFVAQYQNEDGAGPSISEQLGQKFDCDPDESLQYSSFCTTLKCMGELQQCMYAVQTPEANIYERMWCIYEMRTCMTYGLDVQMLMWEEVDMRKSEIMKKGDTTAVIPWIHFAAFERKPINTRAARCGPPVDKHGKVTPTGKDEQMIRGIIEKTIGSYEEIDNVIEVMRAMKLAASCIRPVSVANFVTDSPDACAAKLFKDKAKQVEMIWIRAHPKIPFSQYWRPFQHLVEEAKREIFGIRERLLYNLHEGNHVNCKLGRIYHDLRADKIVMQYNTYVEHITGEPLVQGCERDEVWYREFNDLRLTCALEEWEYLFTEELKTDSSLDAKDIELLVKGRIIERYGLRLNAKDVSLQFK